MTLVQDMARFLDPQFTLLLLNNSSKHSQLSSDLQALEMNTLKATLRADDYLAAGGDATRAEEMRREASTASDANAFYAAGQYEKALVTLKASGTENLWGEYAANIMLGNQEKAAGLIPKIYESVEKVPRNDSAGFLAQLNERAWFVHWILFPLFRIDRGREKLVELYFQSQCMTCIQAACPWILRYLSVAVITTLGPQPHVRQLKDLSRVVSQEAYEYKDEILDFVSALTVTHDSISILGDRIEKAKQALIKDYFCAPFAEQFAKICQGLAVSQYAKSHTAICLANITQALGISDAYAVTLLDKEHATKDSDSRYVVQHTPSSLSQRVKSRINTFNQRASSTLAQHRAKNNGAK